MTYSDAYLLRYLEGDLSAEEAQAVESALLAEPDFERRLMALDGLAGPVRVAFEGLPIADRLAPFANEVRAAAIASSGADAAAPPEPEPTTDSPANRNRAPWAAMVASLGVAVFALGWAMWPTPSDWRIEVARYQALYVPQTVAHLDTSPEVVDLQLKRVEAAVGVRLSQAELNSLQGYTFKRAQVLGFEGHPLIQLVYTDDQGTPIALCFMQADYGRNGPAMMAGLASHSWGKGSHQFFLIGGTDQDRLDAMAAQVKALNLGDNFNS